MSETVGAGAAHRYRDRMKAKAERLGEGDDARKVDASDFEPAEKLYAGVKTGMRPISRQARKDGGAVTGKCAGGRADRPARKAGGGLGTSYVNRDSKAADEEREGHYPNGGMKKGGRAKRAGGGFNPLGALGGILPMAISELSGGDKDKDDNALGPTAAAAGKAGGGYISQASGPTATRALKGKTGSSAISTEERPAAEDGRRARASGGRVARQAGGPLATPLSAGMGGQGRFNFNYGPQTSEASKLGIKTGGRVRSDGGRAKAHERYGAGPGHQEHHPGMASGGRTARAGGGRIARAPGGGAPAPGPDEGPYPIDRPPLSKLKGRYARPLTRGRAEGGSVEKKVLAAHHAEHEAMKKGRASGGGISDDPPSYERAQARQGRAAAIAQKAAFRAAGKSKKRGGHVEGCECPSCTARKAKGGLLSKFDADARANGGRAQRAKGGKAGTKINIIIAPGGANPPDPNAPPGGGLPPNLAVKPPPAMPMPMPGGAPPPGAPGPMPMPIPIPMGGAGAGGPPMPPRARGGRAPEAGSGSGLGRLHKIAEYGTKGPPGRSV